MRALLVAFSAALLAAPAHAQPWPAKPLHLVVALPAGSGADLIARIVAPRVAERLGQPVLVDNRPGAADNIGMGAVARSAPDGYTLLLAVTSLVTNPHLYKLDYDPLRDLIPVSQVARSHYVLVAKRSLPVQDLPELLALARARPATLSCAHAGGALHIGCAWLRASAAIEITLVPYKGGAQALGDVVAGHADMAFAVLNTALSHVRAGRVRALATTDAARGSGPLGDLPTAAEAIPGLVLVSWVGIMAPQGTPPEIVARLNRAIGEALGEAGVRRSIEEGGLGVAHGSPAQFGELIRRDHARYGEIIRSTGIRAE